MNTYINRVITESTFQINRNKLDQAFAAAKEKRRNVQMNKPRPISQLQIFFKRELLSRKIYVSRFIYKSFSVDAIPYKYDR